MKFKGSDAWYIFRWRKLGPERFNKRCKVIVRGAMNSCLIEFEDGFRVVTSRNALMKAKTQRGEND